MRLFISYAHVDKPVVDDWIVRKLRAGSHQVWIDESLTAGKEWKPQLEDAIRDSDALVYAMTPESISSEVCQWEVKTAIELGKPIVPVLLQARTVVPDWLSGIQYVDFSEGATGDAVARLIGGLQQLTPSKTNIPRVNVSGGAQIPPTVTDPKAQSANPLLEILGHPAVQGLIGLMGLIIAVIAIVQPGGGGNSTDGTRSAPTPATPVVVALRDLEIRTGPGSDFDRLNILPIDDSLDILGISEDRLWYQILLRDGRTGWVLASSSGARLDGDRGVLRVVVPSPTASMTPSLTPTSTDTPSPTPEQPTATETDSPTDTPAPTFTSEPSPTEAQGAAAVQQTPVPPPPTSTETPSIVKAFPCNATIRNPDGSATVITVIYSDPSTSSQRQASSRVGDVLILQRVSNDTTDGKWYLAYSQANQRLGWISERYVSLSNECPS